jgi:PAS domain-containing protein
MIKQREIDLEENGKALVVVRSLAAAFRQFGEFGAFVAGLEAALGQTEYFDRAAISLFPRVHAEEGAGSFPPSTLCLPLPGNERVLGMVSFSSEGREFGPADLHLMAGLAEVVAVMADHALRFGEQRRNLALLDYLLNQAPVGVLCFDEDGRVLVANSIGRRLAARTGEEEGGWALPQEWRKEVVEASDGFHREVNGKLLHVAIKRAPSSGGDGVCALVLTDLTPEVDRFREGVARETYRCGWLGKPLTLAILHAREGAGALMAVLESLRSVFPWPAIVGPSDVQTLGIVLPECRLGEAMGRIHEARAFLNDEWDLGVASIADDLKEPEALAGAAWSAKRRVKESLKRTLLLHDDYPSVNDMLEMVLRDRFRLTKSSDFAAAVRHLRSAHYDGIFTEVELSNGAEGLQLVRIAQETCPAIVPFFTTAAAMARKEDPRFAGQIVFQKPFDVTELRASVEAAFG